ncbi:RteC domain-containing protein [Flavivirga jejuensis]|uniref:RteC domain-containing protein n=1 Tax=Flavivirga jejuensis TaxID=870487 RepID=A0ABT8WVA6_9FLAO|nr:RteC domain-containing protein [Flavivirga jejuensis]MDO5977113.1 RteC domain-containing protein [Flavivirga jejuensis]
MYQEEIKKFQVEIEKIKAQESIDLKQAIEGIQLSHKTLCQLKNIFDNNVQKSEEDEVNFFKMVKVIPLSTLVYFSEIRCCHTKMPKMGIKNQLSFLNKKVQKINKFFLENLEFVQYMNEEQNYLDKHYFTLKSSKSHLSAIPDVYFFDPNYFTTHDMLWAKIKGLNEFSVYLKKLMLSLKTNNRDDFNNLKNSNTLVWTQSKAALAELIYALHASAAISDGNEGIKSITLVFEKTFNIKLDNIYKTYSEIKMRKGRKAKFLDELTNSLNHKITQDDAL